MTRPPDDLLTPTLTKADNVLAHGQPWNPTMLVVLTFILGMTVGGGLLALNFKRLGQPGRVRPALLVVGGVIVLVAAVTGWLLAHYDLAAGGANVRQGYRFALRLLNLAVALGIARFQHGAFRSYQRMGHPAGPLFKPALLAFLLGLVLEVGLTLLFTRLWSL